MLRSVGYSLTLLTLSALSPLSAAIFPDRLGDFTKSAPKTVMTPDLPLYQEYGIQDFESAEYTAGPKHFAATAWRFNDATGALALFQARVPSGAKPLKGSKLAVSTSDGEIFADNNYLFQFTGDIPNADLINQLYGQIPNFAASSLPLLLDELPTDGLIPNSQRYILGPVSLQRFDPLIAPSVAAFHLGAEAELGQYQTPKGNLTLAIFYYPTPGIARQQYDEFSKIPGAVAKRVGPMVAITIRPPDADAAERVLAQVRYEANVTLNEAPPVSAKQVGGVLISIIGLAGIILGLCLIAGIGFGAFRVILRKLGWNPDARLAMIELHLNNK